MPILDKTGPRGKGPMTGQGLGKCAPKKKGLPPWLKKWKRRKDGVSQRYSVKGIVEAAEDQIKKRKVRIRKVSPKNMGEYAGMNAYAAKEMGFPHLPENMILVDGTMSPEMQKRTIKHEVVERELMKRRGMRYWPAHKIALLHETD